jgi:hypothetical protein
MCRSFPAVCSVSAPSGIPSQGSPWWAARVSHLALSRVRRGEPAQEIRGLLTVGIPDFRLYGSLAGSSSFSCWRPVLPHGVASRFGTDRGFAHRREGTNHSLWPVFVLGTLSGRRVRGSSPRLTTPSAPTGFGSAARSRSVEHLLGIAPRFAPPRRNEARAHEPTRIGGAEVASKVSSRCDVRVRCDSRRWCLECIQTGTERQADAEEKSERRQTGP